MIDIFDSETMVKVYRLLNKKCDAIDRFINNHALFFSSSEDCEAVDIYDNIINLMVRKNRLINLKLIIDNIVKTLSDNDRKILYLKMNYNLSMANICTVLNIKLRTAFRRLEHAYDCLKNGINNSMFAERVTRIMKNEDWIASAKEEIKEYRLSFSRANIEAVSSL